MPLAIIPRPLLLQPSPTTFTLNAETTIVAPKGLAAQGELLRGFLVATGLPLPSKEKGGGNAFVLQIDRSLARLGEEGYTLDAGSKGVVIRAAKPAGIVYGIQTLRQMLPTSVFRKAPVAGVAWTVPGAHIEDRPRFVWRGAHLDPCRHFMPKESLLKFVDLLSMHKLNRFHLHLTDDQGWRIEIKRAPRLTEVGSRRAQTVIGHNTPAYDGTPHGGFYTQDDLRELVAYAAARNVTVMPEIEMPGHATAAVAAYPELGNTGKPVEVTQSWGVFDDILNVEDSTVDFMKGVLDETLAIFPSTFIHIGGDEAPKTQWKASPRVQARMRELGLKDEHEMQSWFVRQMDAYLTVKGRRLVGWDEILEGGLAPGATVMSWRGEAGGIAAARSGHDVIMAPNEWTYLDKYQGEAKGEPMAIGGLLPLAKVYAYEPIPATLTAQEAQHVLGAQGQLWTEYIPNFKQVEYMAYPRLSALSEVLWSPKEGKSYEDFLLRLRPGVERLRALDVNLRMPEELRP